MSELTLRSYYQDCNFNPILIKKLHILDNARKTAENPEFKKLWADKHKELINKGIANTMSVIRNVKPQFKERNP